MTRLVQFGEHSSNNYTKRPAVHVASMDRVPGMRIIIQYCTHMWRIIIPDIIIIILCEYRVYTVSAYSFCGRTLGLYDRSSAIL